eukprot:TRINITY_DN58036_c0_g1_i1.p1 TRINITY_DN58036_c0_g1~~TRINITY_DN58036_c0_g1_i1.p1  ORF type:complete len:109 (-),score=2.99 TRINITY_DN58036_c0_g1_i1:24-350(-)
MTTCNINLHHNKMLNDRSDYLQLIQIIKSINSNCDRALQEATSYQHDLMKYNVVLPSGPRLSYEGLYEDEQKVISPVHLEDAKYVTTDMALRNCNKEQNRKKKDKNYK